ncbi:PQQ-dependent dehydrogenase, methanol/ethanol family [Komagataeibacter europaeus]|uniref:PQQ-dependent dehydrogenase, methanol/ethanol family n=1 Tax=Komagataeibacter europaeus TaxID=33995 RepID=UPI0004946E19|nr:PQQ-dependent dehydrogenase, methanol/ethanol family [Komagataeibacter europaeus]
MIQMKPIWKKRFLAIPFCGFLAVTCLAVHEGVAAPTSTDWSSYGGNQFEQHFSPLAQITHDNAHRLKLAWHHDFDTNRGQEGIPIVVDGVMYASSNWSRVFALEAATGRLLWSYDPRVPGDTAWRGCCDTVNRGVAYWHGMIYVGTFDGRLVALDARTGREVWSVNTIPPDAILGKARAYSVDGAPRIAHGNVIIGNGGAELGARGFVSAFDGMTGKLKWRFFTVPNVDDEADHAVSDPVLHDMAWPTWSPTEAWRVSGGGGTVWDSILYDPVTDLVYIGVGNGSPWNYKLRSDGKGDNLFLGSVVAVKPDTGEYVWHFQETPRDQWDYTSTQTITTADLPVDGQVRHVILHAPKNGFFYMIDARTGQFLSGRNYVFVNWATGLDPHTGRPLFTPDALYTLTGRNTKMYPGALGAHNFPPMAYSPLTRLAYIPAQQVPETYHADKVWSWNRKGWNLGLDGVQPADMADMKGWTIAWDPVLQQERFRIDHTGPWNGGMLVTGGDILFQGLSDGTFHAYDALNGQDLFSFPAQSGIIGTPMTYSIDGIQYVAIEVGWGGTYPLYFGGPYKHLTTTGNRSRLLVFALEGNDRLPDQAPHDWSPVRPPARFDTAAAQRGAPDYATYCIGCHGHDVMSGGVLPDLRWSGALSDDTGFYNVVGRGALTAFGMDEFGSVLSRQKIEDIRQFIIQQANRSWHGTTDGN